ncbi:TPA: YcaO-like family protein [Pseudomonas putida]|nr:YcaO-like family protein [Pseudomonas putida]
MNSFTIAEREFTLAQAEQRFHAELENLKLHAEHRVLGQRVVAVQACISSDKQHGIAWGSGKGYLPCAHVGALYETLEHYLSDHFSTGEIHCIPTHYFSSSPLFIDDTVLAPLIEQSNALTACRTYTDILKQTSFHYPVALCTPNYSHKPLQQDTTQYAVLKRYASNNGTAIGASYNEAVLHAANECIERDAVSLFLLEHFYYENRPVLRRVARVTANEELGQLWQDAEAEIGAEILLIDISNEFLPHTFLAFSTESCNNPRVFGSGCSISARHGAWRALTELVQMHHATSQPQVQYDLHNAQRHLVPFPRLLRCQQFDLSPLLTQCEHLTVELPEAPPEPPLAEQIHRLATDLHRHGRTLGVTQLHQTNLGTTLVNVVIPGLERFFVVSSGNVVTPQARGRRLHKNQGVSA